MPNKQDDYSTINQEDDNKKNIHQDYWLRELSGELNRSRFQYDYKETVPNVRIIDSVEFRFSGEIFSKLMRFSEESDLNLYKVLTAGLISLLGKYSYTETGLKDIIVGAPVLFKQRKGIETRPVNSLLALRCQFEENITFKNMCIYVGKIIEEANEHKDYPVENLPRELGMQVFGDDFPLFDMAISLENIQDKRYIRHLNVNMIFSFFRTGKYIDGVVEFVSSLYERTSIGKIISYFTDLLRSALADPNKDKPLSDLDILPPEERKQLLYNFNDEKMEYPKDKTLHELFEEKVEQTPDNAALVFQDKQLSYRVFNQSANQLGRLLREKGIMPDCIAGIMVDRSIEMLVGIMAVLKAGGAYLPINPSYPADRVRYLLKDSDSKLLLTQEQYLETIEFDREKIDLEDKSLSWGDNQNLEIVNIPTDLAYIIYTSGSTGQPKGVMLQHASAVNTLMALYDKYPLEDTDTYLLKTSFMFDVSVSELFGWFWGGGRLSILVPGGEKDPLLMIDKIGKEKITHINFVPSMFNLFVNVLDHQNISKLSRLKYIFLAGEAIWADSIVKFRGLNSNVITENIYGPTEATIYASRYPIDQWQGVGSIPIGIPMDNTKLYILGSNDDEHPGLKPGGIPGELAISGIGLARGYLNRPELTSEKFIDNPFAKEEGWNGEDRKLYRTGDLAVWMPDGNIEYLGRIDHQVKVRGFRIETGEIETNILKQPNIIEAVVIARDDVSGEKYLCAYLVADEKIDISLLKSTLLESIPDYMVPSYFMQLDRIPLNPSGKVNRKVLPDPTIKRKGENYVPPHNEIEEKLVGIWSHLLHMKKDIISIDDNFFHLGGHSLKAAIMITEIHKILNVKVLMHQLFDRATVRKLAAFISGAKEEKFSSIDKVEKKEYYPQTSAQKRLFFIDQLESQSTIYNIQLMDIYCKGIEKVRLKETMRKLIRRHESLRTSFFAIEGEAVQKIHDFDKMAADFEIEYWETDEDGMIYSDEAGKEWTKVTGLPFKDVIEHFVRTFDLSKPPLIRVGLIKIWGQYQILMIDMHHIMSDGVSEVLLIKDLWAVYDEKELPPLPIQYKDFAQWINNDEHQSEVKKQESYWLKHFTGEIPVLNLPYDYPRPANLTFDGDSLYFEIGREETQKLNTMALEQGVTLYMILIAVYNILLAKITGQEDTIIGTASAGRNHADLQNIIGMFVDTLALRNYPGSEKVFKEFLSEVKERTLKAFENQDYPFEELVSLVAQRKDKSRNPLFDVVFTLENEAERTDQYLLDVLMLYKSSPYRYDVKKSKFDMSLIAADTGDGLQFTFEYNTQLFKEDTVDRLIKYLKKIVSSICQDIEQKIMDIEIIPDLERGLLLYAFNDTESEYPKDKTINELFEEQVAKTPGSTALVGMTLCAEHMAQSTGELERLTYQELNEKFNQLARALRNKGIKPNTIAAVMVEPSQEMIIGLMGILKAGGAFLPIKDGTPKDRTEYILRESGTRFLLTRNQLLEGISFKGETLELDNPEIYSGDRGNPRHVNTPNDLAYVIYTSGSTGKPKGVLCEHRTAINLCYFYNRYFEITPGDRATKYASLGFDASVWEIFPHLLKGASLYIVPEEIKLDIQKLNRYFEDNGITVSFLPTQIAEQFMSINNRSLRVLQAAGDKLKSFVQKNYQLYNCYGPTENTVCATVYLVTEFKPNIPIGKPIDNNQVVILDKNDHLQPIGVPGELCLGGSSVARGYLNNPQLTREKFVENPYPLPYPLMQSPILYRTGDLARWLMNGNIEFLGRIDYQVKIRGFRIELGEIENRLLHIENIKDAVVIAREDTHGQKYLCAYFVADKTKDSPSIKETLSKNLPDYMIPSFFVQIEKVPLNPSGKIDTKALPAPEAKGVEYTAPRNENEKILANIWSEVLGIEKVGIDDNFFEMGGDSIKTILISSRLLKRQLSTNVNDFFLYPTIRQLADHIKKIERMIEQGIVTGEVELTPIQGWFFEHHLPYSHHFNQSVLLYREQGFDEEIIKKVFTKIVEHHDALRMVYGFEKDKIIQTNGDIEGKLFDLEKIQLTQKKKESLADEIKIHANRIQQGIDLKTGPLVKLALFKGDKGDHLLIVIHHLVVDGVSWRILIEDFETGYQQVSEGKEIVLQDKTDSFQYWAQKLSEYAGSKWILKELDYWKEIEDTEAKTFPVDHDIANEQRKFQYHDIVPLSLSEEKTQQLLTRVNWAYNTEINDILLTALGLAVKQWAGLDKVLVNLEGHGREKIIEDVNINRTVGWFTTQYPIILAMKNPEDLSFSIKNVKEILRRIPNKGIGHSILKYLTPDDKKQELQFKQTPEIVFNYLGQFGDESFDVIDRMSEISDASTGDSIAPGYIDNFKIDIEGAAVDGKLNLYFFYHKNEYERKTIEKLAEIFKSTLEQVINHCVSRKQRELTPSDLGYNKLTLEELEHITSDIKVDIAADMEIQLIYPLSPMQAGMLYHALKNKETYAYFEQSVFTVYGNINKDMMEESLNQLIARYDIFRTIFAFEQLAEPVQIVLKNRKAQLYYEDITHLNERDREKYLEEFKKKDKDRGFELSRDLLIRLALFRTTSDTSKLVLSFHHTLMDGWCLAIIFKELSQIFYSLKEGTTIELEPVMNYVDYIRWLEKQDKEEGLLFWENFLKDYEEPAILPKSGRSLKEDEYKVEEYQFIIDETLTASMEKISRENQVTINTLFQTIWGILLQKYNNRSDVVFGTIVSGRPTEIEGIERMVGLFINMIPVRVDSTEEHVFSQLLRNVQEEFVSTKPYEYLPVAEIQSRTALKGGLIDHIMVFENYPLEEEIKSEEQKQVFTLEGMEISEQTNYDFNVIVIPWKHYIINFNYNGLVYDRDLVEHFALHSEKVIRQVVENPGMDIREIEIITEKEKNKILYEFNNTKQEYPINNTIHSLFLRCVEKTPGNIGLKYHDNRLTYAEVNERANQLAQLLREKGIKPNHMVGIMVERSFEMIVGIMAILKAGSAYLPIDPHYPEDRIKYLFKDSKSHLLLTQEKHIQFARTVEFEGEVINLDDESLYQGDTSNLDIVNHPTDVAYIIYTSGSTGKPKGVMIEHTSAINTLSALDRQYPLEVSDAYLLKTAFLFDVSVSEIFGWYWRGGKLVILEPGGEKDPMMMIDIIEEDKITHINFVPSLFNAFIDVLSHRNISKLSSLKYIFLAGEAIWPDSIIKFRDLKTNIVIDNIYGPTESTIYASWYPVAHWQGVGSISIGKPFDNTQLYILGTDEKARTGMHPVGIPGELCISGIGLARGYLNRPELTAEKFTENPFASKAELDKTYKKLYRTGDLTRWGADGNVEYMGRIDFQVKVRGFRIELGEIENKLSRIDKIKEGVVLARESKEREGEKYLCAYIVAEKPLDKSMIRKELLEELPEYMVPAYIVQLDKMPLNPSGKIDRKALPEPGMEGITREYIPPTNEIEQALADVWAEVLGIKKVSIDDNFFEIGGDSIKTILIIGRLMKRHLKLNMNDFFSKKTIRKLAKCIEITGPEVEKEAVLKDEKMIEANINKDYDKYLEKVKQEEWPDLTAENNYKHILLTGATGYLCAYLLFELLDNTKAVIYLLLRGETREKAEDRFKRNMVFYFGDDFYDIYKYRIVIIKGNLRDSQLGIDSQQYEKLSGIVDAVVHPAASVKHYGDYRELYKDNVEATEHLLEFAAMGKKKDFHFISTMDTGIGDIEGKDFLLYTEYVLDEGQESDNVYVKSKFEAEKRVAAYREKGLNTSIYRAGNMTFHSQTGLFQENIEENFFYSMLKALIKVGFLSEKIRTLEFDLSFVDHAARAIVLLLTRKSLKNQIYHIANPHIMSWSDMADLLKKSGITPPVVDTGKIKEHLAQFEGDSEYETIIERVNIYSWIWEKIPKTLTAPKIDRTVELLTKLGFEWPKIDKEHIEKMINHCKKVGFIS